MKKDMEINKETKVEIPQKINITTPLNGCMWFIILCFLIGMAHNGKKWSDIKVEEEKVKLQQLKDGTLTDTISSIKPDTLKIGNHQKEYISLIKAYQNNKQR